MGFSSVAAWVAACQETQLPMWEVILRQDLAQDTLEARAASLKQMKHMWKIMKNSASQYQSEQRSYSGLVGGDGARYAETWASGILMGDCYWNAAIATALKVSECNACMKRIVAAPTAGACGVLPAVLVTYYKEYNVPEEKMIEAMYVAAGLGQIIANRAYLAGASGGCQAEIGSGSGMAAGAICYIKGGDTDQIGHACAMALKNLMGLVCDPVGGLVEVPCVKRNVGGAVNALAAADMALAGITSKIPVDQVIDAMKEVGDKMDVSLRETGVGGVAGTPAAQEVVEKLGM